MVSPPFMQRTHKSRAPEALLLLKRKTTSGPASKSLSNPGKADVGVGAEAFCELTGVMGQMAKVVELQFEFRHWQPVETG
jgi:hypothetical protein